MLTTMGDARGASGPSIDEEVRWYFTPGHPDRDSIRDDPYPFYDRMRDADRVYEVDGIWFVAGFTEANELVRNPSWLRHLELPEDQRRISDGVFLDNFTFYDEPDHGRLRKVVAPAFTPGMIEKRRERIREIVRSLLDDLRERDEFEFINHFAGIVPAYVMGEMLGVPAGNFGDLIRWSKARDAIAILSRVFDAAGGRAPAPKSDMELAGLAELDRAAIECQEFFGQQIARRETNPGDDLISFMLADSQGESARISHHEIINMCMSLHLAGHGTTANMLTNGLLTLGRHPQAYRDLAADPSLIPGAVEEMLRYESPVRSTVHRLAPGPVQLGTHLIPEGSIVYAMLGAANRDPEAFSDPHVFDIRRQNNRHLSFAGGPRFCIGAFLARAELQEAFRILITEYPRLEFDLANPRWRDSFVFRALEELPVRWSDR
ncbi:MAG: cytochrome P450 [Acidimicrobiia bacterium]